MKEEHMEKRRILRFLPFKVDLDELATRETILTIDAEKTLAGFQLQIFKTQKTL